MKKKRYQLGGAIPPMPTNTTFVAPRPLQLPNYRAANLPLMRDLASQANALAKVPTTPDNTAKIQELKAQVMKLASMKNPSYQTGGDLVSQLGYQDSSPFNQAPFLNINSPNISMENVSTPLIGVSNQTGETKLMKPNKKYNFKNTKSVTEIPAYNQGGTLNSPEAQGILGAVQTIGPMAGPWGMAAAGVASILPTIANLFGNSDKNKVVSGSPGQYQSGGDIALSSDAFQVQGNPNVTDGNKYRYGGNKIALDHNEVVSDNFVFSEDLESPFDKSFAALAKIQEKVKGKVEKVSAITPYDPIASKTMKHTQSNLSSLAALQETIATMKGHRNPDGSTVQNYQTGGTIAAAPSWMNVQEFQKWYNQQAGVTPLAVDNK